MAIRDDLAEILAGDLNKKFKGNKVAYFLDGSDQTPTDVDDFANILLNNTNPNEEIIKNARITAEQNDYNEQLDSWKSIFPHL